jgi:hypothetical protein
VWQSRETAKGSNRGADSVNDKSLQGWYEPDDDKQRNDDVTKESDRHPNRKRSKTMKKILSAVCMTTFILTGCSMDSIFEGGLPFTLFCFGVMAISGYFAFCGKGE